VPADPLGLEGTGFQGHNMWSAKNPEFGAVFSIHFKEDLKSLKDVRQEKEKALEKEKKDVFYPSFDDLRKEQQDQAAVLIWSISDASGKEIRRMTSTPSKGISRLSWDLRNNNTNPVNSGGKGLLVTPGTYYVSVTLAKNGTVEQLITKQAFNVKGLNNQTLVAKNPEELKTFRAEVAELNRKVSGAGKLMNETKDELEIIEQALINYPNTDLSLLQETRALKLVYDECALAMWGDKIKEKHEFEFEPSISARLGMVEYQLYDNTTGVSKTHKQNKDLAEEQYNAMRLKLNEVIKRLEVLETKLDAANIPYTKSKGANWKKD
jgi:hypothetical protein